MTISNKLTEEVEYVEVCNTDSAVINLCKLALKDGGTYTIEVSTEIWKKVGEFIK